jgi:hypothetical protein
VLPAAGMCMARGVAMMREAWLDMRVLRLYRSCKEHTLPVRHQTAIRPCD